MFTQTYSEIDGNGNIVLHIEMVKMVYNHNVEDTSIKDGCVIALYESIRKEMTTINSDLKT